jgi:tetratricopeptide (TPR) repeat protein
MLANYAQAAVAWQQSLTIEPTRTAYTNTGIAFYNTGQFEEAARMQAKAVELAPNDHRAVGRLADAQRFVTGDGVPALENYARAADLAKELLAVNDQDWRTLGLLSHYLAQLGQEQEANSVAQQALRLSLRNAETLFYSALVKLAAGHVDASLELLEEAVNRDGYYRHLIEIDPDMKQLAEMERFQSIISASP